MRIPNFVPSRAPAFVPSSTPPYPLTDITIEDPTAGALTITTIIGAGKFGDAYLATAATGTIVIKAQRIPGSRFDTPVYLKAGLHHILPDDDIPLPRLLSHGTIQFPNDDICKFITIPHFTTNMISCYAEVSDTTLLVVIHELIRAAQYLASKHIVHADIKLDNVCVDDTGRVFLIDLSNAETVVPTKQTPPPNFDCGFGHTMSGRDQHAGRPASFRNDSDAIVYNTVVWSTNALPWSTNMTHPRYLFKKQHYAHEGKLVGSTRRAQELLRDAMHTDGATPRLLNFDKLAVVLGILLMCPYTEQPDYPAALARLVDLIAITSEGTMP